MSHFYGNIAKVVYLMLIVLQEFKPNLWYFDKLEFLNNHVIHKTSAVSNTIKSDFTTSLIENEEDKVRILNNRSR